MRGSLVVATRTLFSPTFAKRYARPKRDPALMAVFPILKERLVHLAMVTVGLAKPVLLQAQQHENLSCTPREWLECFADQRAGSV